MQINKTAGLDAEKTASKSVKNNVSIKNNSQAQASENSNVKNNTVMQSRSAASLANALGLPQDKLSVSVLSLARFFSLAFKPEQLAAIRREAFGASTRQPSAQNTQTAFQSANAAALTESAKNLSEAQVARTRQILALTAAAAESKGVELQPKALETYTEAVDPDSQKQKDGGEKKDRRQRHDTAPVDEEKTVTAAGVKELALDNMEDNPVLSIMNRLPGKSGHRWVVLPFEFSKGGKSYFVSMRILLEKDGDNAAFMALDIKEEGGSRKEEVGVVNRLFRSFALEFAGNKVKKLVYYTHEVVRETDKKELADLFDIPAENVFVGTCDVFPVPEAEQGEKLLRFVDEVA